MPIKGFHDPDIYRFKILGQEIITHQRRASFSISLFILIDQFY
jgi:hypothetical protein